jgi:hypothetical protein
MRQVVHKGDVMSNLDDESGATLIIRRPDGGLRDWMRRYIVAVDGETVAKLRRRSSVSLPVSKGEHRVEARVDYAGAVPLQVAVGEGEAVELHVQPAGGVLRSFDQLAGRRRYLSIKRVK